MSRKEIPLREFQTSTLRSMHRAHQRGLVVYKEGSTAWKRVRTRMDAINAELRRRKEAQPAAPPITAQGWPCKTFISDPIYRRVRLGLDVQINRTGVIMRQTTTDGTFEARLSWVVLQHKALITPQWRKVT